MFEVPADFNLHIERKSTGSLIVKQSISADGEFADAVNFGLNAGKIINSDFAALVYPKWIKVVSSSEVVKAFVTCPDGEVNQALPFQYEFVDLGLPSGTMWATTNVGATKPEESGLFFQWGDTQGYKVTLGDIKDASQNVYNIESMEPEMKQFASDFSDYKFYSNGSYTKYNGNDGLTTLELSDDTANAYYSKMRMPTKEEYNELRSETTSVWTNNYNGTNVKGWIFTSKVDETKSIFIPATGAVLNGAVLNAGFGGLLWTSSFYDYNKKGCAYNFDSSLGGVGDFDRYFGTAVRGVLIN